MRTRKLIRREFLQLSASSMIAASTAPARIVIAGAGIMGASIAYHLVKRGARVTVLEKAKPGSGTTANSFAWINATFSKQPRRYYDLNLLGIANWRRLDREFQGALPIQWSGSVEWYPKGKEAEEFRHKVEQHQSWGYATHFLEESEFGRLLPGVAPGPVAVSAYSENEGAVDPVRAVEMILGRARELGATVQYPCELTGLDLSGGKIRGVLTTDGKIDADVLVAASGIDTPRVAQFAGVRVPLKDAPGLLAHTPPLPRLLDRIALAPGAHIKQCVDGRIITGSDFGGTPVLDATRGAGLDQLRRAAKFFPALMDAGLDRVTLGRRVMPQDEYPIAGFAEGCPNLYIAAMHSGVTLAALMGHLAALEILDGARVDLLAPYRLSRFG